MSRHKKASSNRAGMALGLQNAFNPHANAPSKVPRLSFALVDGTKGECQISDAERQQNDQLGRPHAKEIMNGMKHSWEGYRAHAWGADELKPVTGTRQDNWGGMGMTLIDSLDTLHIMNMKDEFAEAVEWVGDSLSFAHAQSVSVFETTIRALGGLLSAYDRCGDPMLLDKAKQLGDLLLPAFDTPSGIPRARVNLQTHRAGNGWCGDAAILSEMGTLQLEFRYLAVKTGDSRYESKSMIPLRLMRRLHRGVGLFPTKINIQDGSFADNHITFGALGDSFYEYLLKLWLQGGKKETWLREMYDEAIDGVVTKLLDTSTPTGYLFVADLSGGTKIRKMDHFVAFLPAVLALGAYNDPHGLESPRAQRDLAIAKALLFTCRQMYHTTNSGLAPEYVKFPHGEDICVGVDAPCYNLRPETAKSLFVLHQLTGDPTYREWAHEIWTAINRHCRTRYGYGPLRDVRDPDAGIDNRMESFHLSETLKYLYLTQLPEKIVDLTTHVLTTEAHPLKMFSDAEHVPATE